MVYRASATQATQAKPGPANLLSHTIPSRPTALARCSDRHVQTTCSSSVPMLFILYLGKLFVSAREAIQYSVNIAYNVSINHSQCPFPCVADTVIWFVPLVSSRLRDVSGSGTLFQQDEKVQLFFLRSRGWGDLTNVGR